MIGGFSFGGKNSSDYSIRVEKLPAITGAARRRSTYRVPGRNGALHIDEGAFDNYTQPYECHFGGRKPTPEMAHAITAWLSRSGAYQRLEDTYDPDCFRLATFAGPLDVENILNKYGRCTINFDCKPQCFLKSGEEPVLFEASGELENFTAFDALPLITAYGEGEGMVYVNEIIIDIKEMTDYITLDSELMDAYRKTSYGALENMNSKVKAAVFPVLRPGTNYIGFGGGVDHIDIIPRWWTL